MDGRDIDALAQLFTPDGRFRSRNGVTMIAGLRYRDRYRRHEGCWRFADRLLSFTYFVPVEQYASALGATDRMRAYDTPRQADLPETLPSWTDYQRRYLR